MVEDELKLNYFVESGFSRRKCKSCGTIFWTLNPELELCGDTPCVEYEFIDNPPIPDKYDSNSMRKTYIDFFAKLDHTPLKRYPVVARWRDDIYLTIASIADFQPHVTSGLVEPPANPLIISQPCIRLVDLDVVGKSGRHLSNFEMVGPHAFNRKGREIYWKETAVEYCHRFFTEAMKIQPELITYREEPWVGGGNAGQAMEVMVRGLELATLVFMNLKYDEKGSIELKGERFSPMDMYIVDPGYGLERTVWSSLGTATIYEAIYPDMVAKLAKSLGLEDRFKPGTESYDILREYAKLAGMLSFETSANLMELRRTIHQQLSSRGFKLKEEELIELLQPLESIFTITDHSRCLAFMLGDGIVPSNVKAGYLARLVLRRTLRLMDELQLEYDLTGLVDEQLEVLKDDFPELLEMRSTIIEILDLETRRYRETISKGKKLVKNFAAGLKDAKLIPLEQLIELYDSHGIHPSIVEKVARSDGYDVKIPDNFHALISERHSSERPELAAEEKTYDLPDTQKLFYDDVNLREFEAEIIHIDPPYIILNRSIFYPEGGGQPSDIGTLSVPELDLSFEISDVQKAGGVLAHKAGNDLKSSKPINFDKLKVGMKVSGNIDWDRRLALMQHHSSTHIILGAARKVLGDHVWQAGAQKAVDRARVDITHYAKITDKQLREIEIVANKTVLEARPINCSWLNRDEAEKRYGFRLYQGGVPPGKAIRVVEIEDFDVEACAGTHCEVTSQVGTIKILRCDRIQDGVERLEFSTGLAAIRNIQKQEEILTEASAVYSVLPEQLPKTAKRFFSEWKSLRKELAGLRGRGAASKLDTMLKKSKVIEGTDIRLLVHLEAAGEAVDKSQFEALNALGREISELKTAEGAEKIVAVIACNFSGGKIILACNPELKLNCGQLIKEPTKLIGGSGGGRPEYAVGGGPNVSELKKALKLAEDQIIKKIASLK
ncbi:MAG: alanine--tRNA ligase [Thermoplasmata archaeon]|nr:MAG: alanine--tRNA ligase [Thermoplasmata archaeon]